MKAARKLVFILVAIVWLLSQYHAVGASPMCRPYDSWVGCSGVPSEDENFCGDGSAAFCDDQCQEYFGVGSSGNSCARDGYGTNPWIYSVSCYCDVR